MPQAETRIVWPRPAEYMRTLPHLDTYLGLKRLRVVRVFVPGSGVLLESHDFGVLCQLRPGVCEPSSAAISIPIPLKKAKGKKPEDVEADLNRSPQVAFFIAKKNWYDKVIKEVDLYVPLVEGMEIREEYRARSEQERYTEDEVVYSLRFEDVPVLALKVDENRRLSPRNRVNLQIEDIAEKYKSRLGEFVRVWPSNVNDYVDLAEDLKAALAKLPEYEQEGDIKPDEELSE